MWILDSGATDHIFSFKFMFNHLTKIKPVLIKLPNNASVTAEFSGTVKLSNLTLLDVLYVPNFSVSLISISKLTSSLDCLLLFHNSFCMIVQKSHWRMIGTARKSHGLYYLDFTKDLTLPLDSIKLLVLIVIKFL